MPTTKTPPPNQAGPISPATWTGTEQYNRKQEGAAPGRPAGRTAKRTPGGHTVIEDDESGAMTIRHRSGAGFEIGPTGDVTLTAHNGSYKVVFGENRMEVTGTHDITVRGGGTLKVDGDYDCTIGGNMNMACDGDMNFKGKNFNMAASGNMDMVGKNMTMKTEGSAAIHAGGGASITADGAVGISSRGDSASIAGATQVGILAAGGEVAIQSGGATHIKAAGNINMDGAEMHLNSGASEAATSLVTNSQASQPTQQARRTTSTRHA